MSRLRLTDEGARSLRSPPPEKQDYEETNEKRWIKMFRCPTFSKKRDRRAPHSGQGQLPSSETVEVPLP
jgi:hypothetical protein